MRWKIVSSKKPARASETSDAAVFGALFWSRATVNVPQFVVTTRLYVVPAASGSFGAVAPPSGFAGGCSTEVQPSVVVAVVSVDVVSVSAVVDVPSSSPQPAARRRRRAARAEGGASARC